MQTITSTTRLRDGSVLIELLADRKIIRSVRVCVGGTYMVEPPNPQKRKHRGRLCTVLEFMRDEKIGTPFGALVRFLDNNRRGVVDSLAELVTSQPL